jgi:hypothetical protein
MTEVRGQRTEDKGQGIENGIRKWEVGKKIKSEYRMI